MHSITVRIAAVVAMLLASLLALPASPANAASGCGSGWYRESDRYMKNDGGWTGHGYRNAHIWHGGIVRFCTQNDTIADDHNRRVLIGYPSDWSALESDVDKNGRYSQFCVRQIIKVYMTGVKTSESWSIGGSIAGKKSAGVSADYNATYDNMVVRVARASTCSASAKSIVVSTGGVVVTGTSDDSAEIRWVELTTRLDMVYWINGTKYVKNYSLTKKAYA